MLESALDERWADAVRGGRGEPQPVRPRLGAGTPDERDASISRCSRAWRPPRPGPCLAAAGDVLLYAPVVRTDDLPASIAYLTRRLDENTSPENFLRSLFTLEPGSPTWDDQRSRFEAAMQAIDAVSTVSRRAQDRSVAASPSLRPDAAVTDRPFENAADTDWTSEANRTWIEAALASPPSVEVPVLDRVEDIDRVVAAAVSSSWATVPARERQRVLHRVAETMEAERGTTLSLMAHEAAKTVAEGDPEVSEAIDFARYYASGIDRLVDRGADRSGLAVRARRRRRGRLAVELPVRHSGRRRAGGPGGRQRRDAQAGARGARDRTAPRRAAVAEPACRPTHCSTSACPDDEVGRRLVTHPDVGTVVLTGAYETAMRFLEWRPSMRLLAETSGKNAMVITAAADDDAAIDDLVRSAFGHAGQKCSAASLAIVEASVYDDPALPPAARRRGRAACGWARRPTWRR